MLHLKYPNGIVHGLVAGHGGMEDGQYQIIDPGSKQFKFPDGKVVYEGVENRKVKDKILELDKFYQAGFIDLVPGECDVSLEERIILVNNQFTHYKNQGKLLIMWELHMNAGGGTGMEVYTTRGKNYSDDIAEAWAVEAPKLMSGHRPRWDYTDGDADKEKDFKVIKNINTFGALLEFLFFDNRKDVDKWLNPRGYEVMARSVINAALKLNSEFC